MICPDCKSDSVYQEQVKAVIKEQKIPFVCPSCGMIKLPIRATLDRVFVWPDPISDTIGAAGLIYLPEVAKENYKTVYGTVLSCGPGFYDERKMNRFVPADLKAGDRIAYDKDVLYRLTIRGADGKLQKVALMGYQDIHGFAECEAK